MWQRDHADWLLSTVQDFAAEQAEHRATDAQETGEALPAKAGLYFKRLAETVHQLREELAALDAGPEVS